MLTNNGSVLAEEGGLSAQWVTEYTEASQNAVVIASWGAKRPPAGKPTATPPVTGRVNPRMITRQTACGARCAPLKAKRKLSRVRYT